MVTWFLWFFFLNALAKLGNKEQAHIDLGVHSVGKEDVCVSSDFTTVLFLQKEVCIEGIIPLCKWGLFWAQAVDLSMSGQEGTREEATNRDKEAVWLRDLVSLQAAKKHKGKTAQSTWSRALFWNAKESHFAWSLFVSLLLPKMKSLYLCYLLPHFLLSRLKERENSRLLN